MKQGDVLSPIFYNFALEYAIKRVHVNQEGLKLNVTHQPLVNTNDVNVLEGSVHTIRKNAEAYVVARRRLH